MLHCLHYSRQVILDTAPFIMSAIKRLYQGLYALFISMLVLEKRFFGGKQ